MVAPAIAPAVDGTTVDQNDYFTRRRYTDVLFRLFGDERWGIHR